jgi:hypothetical protein
VKNICNSSGGAQERQDETQFTTKIGGKFSMGPSYFRFVKFSFPIMLTGPRVWGVQFSQKDCVLQPCIDFNDFCI